MNKFIITFTMIVISLMMSACTSWPKIQTPTFTVPKEIDSINEIKISRQVLSEPAYISICLDKNITSEEEMSPQAKIILANTINAKLTSSDFIINNPSCDQGALLLNMTLNDYDYERDDDEVSLELEISFTLALGNDEFLEKEYSAQKEYSKERSEILAEENTLVSQVSLIIINKFIAELSPQKIVQEQKFKPIPEKLTHLIPYVNNKEYHEAIMIANKYKGVKDMNYYYNLAILYEAQSCATNNVNLLKLANVNYERAMKLGGDDDSLISNTKETFDDFYSLITKQERIQF